MVNISGMFSAIDNATAIAELLGVSESIDKKMDRLIGSELNAGIRILDQARTCETDSRELLCDARRCFNKAIDLETGYRRGLALMGCAVCHSLLGDNLNRDKLLIEILSLEPTVDFAQCVGEALARGFVSTAVTGFLLWNLQSPARVLNVLNVTMQSDKESMVENSVDGAKLLALQKAVSEYTHVPVRWLEELKRVNLVTHTAEVKSECEGPG